MTTNFVEVLRCIILLVTGGLGVSSALVLMFGSDAVNSGSLPALTVGVALGLAYGWAADFDTDKCIKRKDAE